MQEAFESQLLFANHVYTQLENELTKGDTLRVALVPNMSGAQVVDTNVDLTLYDVGQTCTNIVVNYFYYQSLGLGQREQIQDSPDFLKAMLKKCAYDVALMMDNILADHVNSLTPTEGTEGTALGVDNLINCYQFLNVNNIPEADRCWIFDPESITDLLKLDYFVRMDYVPDGVVSKGFQGRQIFGAPVYMTANLNVINASYHAAVYMHKEAIALARQMQPTTFMFEWPEKFTNVVGVKALFGTLLYRGTGGVWIKTRS